jgi:hypothetical protein
MATSSEAHLRAQLLPPPSYTDASKHQREIVNQYYVPVQTENISPSAPVTTYVNHVEPQSTRHSC